MEVCQIRGLSNTALSSDTHSESMEERRRSIALREFEELDLEINVECTTYADNGILHHVFKHSITHDEIVDNVSNKHEVIKCIGDTLTFHKGYSVQDDVEFIAMRKALSSLIDDELLYESDIARICYVNITIREDAYKQARSYISLLLEIISFINPSLLLTCISSNNYEGQKDLYEECGWMGKVTETGSYIMYKIV